MNLNPSFVRKIVYLCCIAVLLFPLYTLGRPTTVKSTGGQLASLRTEYDLAQGELGEIDVAGESMKLATLGARGVAAAILWHKSQEYKKKEDWDKLSATLNQITKLQPNFLQVWESQAHNLSYNVSVEFDDYRHRYHWVKRGIDFLIVGTRMNRKEPALLWTTGWFFGQKFGRADEHKQFRRLFRVDNDFHNEVQQYVDIDRGARGPDNRPDNWLTGRLWFLKSQGLVDNENAPLRKKSPLFFHNQSAMTRINHAVAIEDEGILDEKAELAWRRASEDWAAFGQREIASSWGELLRLNEYERSLENASELKREFNELTAGIRDQIYKERFNNLAKEEQAVMLAPKSEMTPESYVIWVTANAKLQISHADVADRAPAEQRERIRRLARRLTEVETTAERINRYREQVNFDYWKMRCEAEQLRTTVQARKHMFEGNRLKSEADLDGAEKEFEQAWDLWVQVFEKFPNLVEDRSDDLAAAINNYREVLSALDKKFPENFKLIRVMQAHAGELPVPDPAATPDAKSDAPPPTTNPDESKKDEARKEEAKKEEPATETPKKDEANKDEANKDEANKDEANKDEAKPANS